MKAKHLLSAIKKTYISCVFYCLLTISYSLYGQTSFFETYGSQDGLYELDIRSIEQDSLGYLWIGTSNGLLRFDGFEFESYTFETSEPNTLINTLTKDPQDGGFWVSSFNSSQIHYLHPIKKVEEHFELQMDNVQIIHISHTKNQIWAFSQYGTVFIIDRKSKEIEYLEVEKLIHNVLNISDESWLFGTDEGVWNYDVKTGDLSAIEALAPLKALSIRDMIKHPTEQKIYIATQQEGVFIYAIKQASLKKLELSRYMAEASTLFFSENGTLWVGTMGSGAIKVSFDEEGEIQEEMYYTREEGLSGDYVANFFQDREKSIWIATTDGSFCRFLGGHLTFDTPFMQAIHTIYIDSKQQKWVSTNEGLFVEENEKGWRTILNFEKGNYATTLEEDGKGNLWIGTHGNGVMIYNLKTDKVEKLKSIDTTIINRILRTKDGSMWVATVLDGIYIYDQGEVFQVSTTTGFLHNYIYDLFEDSQGRVWFSLHGAPSGFFLNDEWSLVDKKEVKNVNCNTIVQDNKGNMWVGTAGSGIIKVEKDTVSSIMYDLVNKHIYASFKDKSGQLWFCGRNQIIRVDTAQNVNTYELNDYDSDLQIISNQIAEDDAGALYFATNKGILKYNASRDYTQQKVPEPHFTRLFVFDEEKSFEEIKSLPYDEYIIRFEFHSMSFLQKNRIQYKYQLEGYDDEYSYWTPQTYAKYSRVSDGEYKFKVVAQDNYSHTNESFISFKVAQPFWKTWWFYTGSFLLLITTVYLYSSVRTLRLKRKNQELEALVDKRTEALNNKKNQLEKVNTLLKDQKMVIETAYQTEKELQSFKDDMMGMIVHDLKNPLNSIIISSEEKDKSVRSSAKQMLDLVNNILDTQKLKDPNMVLKTSQASLGKLIDHSISQIKVIAQEKEIELTIKVHTEAILEVDYDLITRVFINTLNNAIKYTPIGGNILINSEQQGNEMIINIKDSGIGIPKADINYIFDKFYQVKGKKYKRSLSTGLGLSFCKMAIEAHKGSIKVDSVENQGTTFSFVLPFKNLEEIGHIVPVKEQKIEKAQELELQKDEKEYLFPFAQKLEDLDIYETSQNMSILKDIKLENPNVQDWRKQLEGSLFNFNEIRYKALISMALNQKDTKPK